MSVGLLLPTPLEMPRPPTLWEGLLVLWPLDEPSGTRRDLGGAGGGHTLTDNNTVTQAPGVAGQTAGQFTAANTEYLSAASHADYHIAGNTRTFGCWVWFDALGAQDEILSVWTQSGSQREWHLQKLSTDFVRIQASNDGANNTGAAQTAGAVVAGRWYWVECGYDAPNNLTFCRLDMGPRATATPSALFSATSDFRIGAYMTTVIDATHNGRIAQVAVWNRLLSDQERAWIVNAGNGRPALVAS